MSKKLTYEYVKSYIESFGYKLLSKEYINNSTKLELECPNGHIFKMIWNNFQRGQRCPRCYELRRGDTLRLNIEYVKEYIESFGYKLLSKEYINSRTKLKIQCKNDHVFYISWGKFKQGHGCRYCSGNYKRSIQEVEYTAKKYGFVLLSKKYINSYTKLKLKCKEGHIFYMALSNLKRGQNCRKCSYLNRTKEGNTSWKGGVTQKNLPLYDTYAHQLNWCEEVRRDPDNKGLLQVRCTNSSCRKWFTPTREEVKTRIKSLNNKNKGEGNFYCSEECKHTCVLYQQKLYPKGFKNYNNRPNQKEWADLVKERDNYTCQICGSTTNLVAHHYEGIYCNPLESADIDAGVTLCKKCHNKAHAEEGCRFIDLRREN